ncbi:MAG: aldo/keto reductase [Actinobacteria bacterium]|nr:aldo/keto reductase [Actinomycetota bacterium]MCB9412503.1 aldo/keto reductase [Actinomycetota bacterium]
MEQRQLGKTGLRVSRLGLGTMTWGRDTDEYDAREILAIFLEAGGTLIDTADVYTEGESEHLVGRLVSEMEIRDQVVLATKAVSRPGTERRFDGSRSHLLTSLEASLRRLRTDHIDLWQLHAWDPWTPLEETLAAVDHAVQSGKVRYVGVSNYCGWQLAAASTWQRAVPGRVALASNQVEYSLLNRGVEREVVPAARHLGVGLLAWSPLGRGVLTGKYRNGTPNDSRGASQSFAQFVQPYFSERAGGIVDAVVTASTGLEVSPVEVALAWVRDQPGVTAPIVGVRTPAHATLAVGSESVELPAEIRGALDDVSAIPLGYPDHGWNQR